MFDNTPEDKAVKEELAQVKTWLLENPDDAALLILNFYMDEIEREIDYESHAMPYWFKIKKLAKELTPIQKSKNDRDTPALVLNKLDNKEKFNEYFYRKENK